MRILHVEDAAAVACILAKYQNQIPGCESRVIKFDKYDKFGFYEFYREYVTRVPSEEQFLNYVLEEAKSVDVIHIHSRVELIPKLRETFGKSKKIVLHYHGTDIRGINKQKLPHRSRQSDAAIRLIFMYRRAKGIVLLKKRIHPKAQSLSDLIVVSTQDLLPHITAKEGIRKIYLPNPIDSDLFNQNDSRTIEDGNNSNGKAVTMDTEVTNIPWILEHLRKHNLNLDVEVYNRIKNPLKYSELPSFLRRYKTYVDIKYVNGKIIPALSKTGLEALACGLDVLDFDLRFRHGLPSEHCPLNVISKLSKEYLLLK